MILPSSAHDRGQGFGQNFAAFAARHVTPGRIKRGKMMLLAYAEPFEKIEHRYGVPAPVLAAIWGLETDFGADLGQYPTFSALATLAYDCRRAQIYRAELIDALMIVQRGLLPPEHMRGAWAGEIGQTQFMPSAYLKYGVNVEGGGGGDLISSPADALASTANFLRGHGWTPGAHWDEGEPNFAALLEWNSAPVYAKTIALFADRLAGARAMSACAIAPGSRSCPRKQLARRARLSAFARCKTGGRGRIELWACLIGPKAQLMRCPAIRPG